MKKSFLLPIFLIVSVDILGMTIVLPLLPFYAEKYGASPFVVGLLVTTYALCQLFSGPMLGRISDRIGRRPMLLLSQIGTLVGFFILAYANSLWVIFVSRIIDGITAGNLSLAQAYISDVSLPKDRAKSFAVIGIAFGLGFLIGPAISGYLSQFGYSTPILAAAALSATSILCTYFLLPANPPVPEGSEAQADEAPAPPGGERFGVMDWGKYTGFFRKPALAQALWRFAFFAFSFSTFVSGFALFAERRYTHHGLPFGPKEVGYIYAYSGLLGILIQGGLIGRLVRRWGEEKLATIGFLSACVGYAFLGVTYHVPALLVAATFGSFGSGVLRPALTSLVSQRAGRKEQGIVLGLTQSLNSLAQIICPAIAGFLIGWNQLTLWAWWAALIALFGFATGFRTYRRYAP